MGMIHQIWTKFLFSDMTRFILSKQSVYKAKTFFDFLGALILSHITHRIGDCASCFTAIDLGK